jgi:hypothetical protein
MIPCIGECHDFGLTLGSLVRISRFIWLRFVSRRIRNVAMDTDRATMYEAVDASRRCRLQQVLGGTHIDSPVALFLV